MFSRKQTKQATVSNDMADKQTRYEALVLALHGDIFRYAYWLVKDKAIAEDIVQETFLRAWKSLDSLKDEKAAKSWLITILRRENARRFERKQFDLVDIDDVAVMDEGQIIQVATPGGIYEAPNSVYVADFIGDVNIIEGTAKPTGPDQYDIAWKEGAEPLNVKSQNSFSDGQACHLAIRPEKVTISADKPADADNAVQGRVLDIAYLGNISTYHVELPTGAVIKAQTANTRRIARRAFTWEDPVWLSWTATAGVMLAN